MKAGYLSGIIVGGLIGACVMYFAFPKVKACISHAAHESRDFIDQSMDKGKCFIDSQLKKIEE